MSFTAILLLAIGLAMDATAVSAAKGLVTTRILPRHVILVALFFGGFQALMPLIGWTIGSTFGHFVASWDHWIAFALLGFIGLKMLWEARENQEPDAPVKGDAFEVRVMLALAIATSIDALAAGITLPMINAPLLLSLFTIGITTAVLSALGLFAGRRFGSILGRRLDVVGGIVLIALGVKILYEHLTS